MYVYLYVHMSCTSTIEIMPSTVISIREPPFENDSNEDISDSYDDDSEAEQTQYWRVERFYREEFFEVTIFCGLSISIEAKHCFNCL